MTSEAILELARVIRAGAKCAGDYDECNPFAEIEAIVKNTLRK